MNLKIREFQMAIINFINQNKLPIEVKRLVLAEVYKIIGDDAERTLACEIEKRDKEEKKKSEDQKGSEE